MGGGMDSLGVKVWSWEYTHWRQSSVGPGNILTGGRAVWVLGIYSLEAGQSGSWEYTHWRQGSLGPGNILTGGRAVWVLEIYSLEAGQSGSWEYTHWTQTA